MAKNQNAFAMQSNQPCKVLTHYDSLDSLFIVLLSLLRTRHPGAHKQGYFLAVFPATEDLWVSEILSFEQNSLSFWKKILEFQQKAWVFDQLLRYCWGNASTIALVHVNYLFEFGKNLTSGSWWISDFPKNWVLKYCLEFLSKNAWVLAKNWLEFWFFGPWVLKK